MELEMIAKNPTNEKWKKIFSNAPDMDPVTKKVKVKNKITGENLFELSTVEKTDPSVKMKFSFVFDFLDKDKKLKYGSIDPQQSTLPPPTFP